MANYFHQRTRWNTHYYYAISDNGSEPDEFGDRRYPYAQVEIHSRRPDATTNFNFSSDDTSPRGQYHPDTEHGQDLVNKDLGMPNAHKYLRGDLKYNHYQASEYAQRAADRGLSPRYRRQAGIDYAKSIQNLKNSMSEMFTTTPEKHTVNSAFSHSSMRHTVPIILAHAHQNLGSLTASDDLSEHSSRMVKRAREKGFPVNLSEDNPDADVTNDYTFSDDSNVTSLNNPENYRKLSNAEVRSAKMHIRTMRGKGLSAPNQSTPSHMSPQFEQLRLPGME